MWPRLIRPFQSRFFNLKNFFFVRRVLKSGLKPQFDSTHLSESFFFQVRKNVFIFFNFLLVIFIDCLSLIFRFLRLGLFESRFRVRFLSRSQLYFRFRHTRLYWEVYRGLVWYRSFYWQYLHSYVQKFLQRFDFLFVFLRFFLNFFRQSVRLFRVCKAFLFRLFFKGKVLVSLIFRKREVSFSFKLDIKDLFFRKVVFRRYVFISLFLKLFRKPWLRFLGFFRYFLSWYNLSLFLSSFFIFFLVLPLFFYFSFRES